MVSLLFPRSGGLSEYLSNLQRDSIVSLGKPRLIDGIITLRLIMILIVLQQADLSGHKLRSGVAAGPGPVRCPHVSSRDQTKILNLTTHGIPTDLAIQWHSHQEPFTTTRPRIGAGVRHT